MRVSHVITSLSVGGAEMMLVKLLSSMDRRQFRSHVISLSTDTSLAGLIRDAGIELDVLGIQPALSQALPLISRVTRSLREAKPDVVQTWLYHADLIGGVAGKRLGVPVIWNIRSGTLDPALISGRTMWTVKACAAMSRFLPRVIVSCSEAAVGIHKALGYQDRFRVIPNGTDASLFRPDAALRDAVRAELGLGRAAPVIGMVARFHAQKDHATFISAAGQLVHSHPEVRFLLCGPGVETAGEIGSRLRAEGLAERFVLTETRHDMPAVFNALDIHTLCSTFGEAFPNVICEAMATGVPCVATDVGDSARIIGDAGVIIPMRDPDALAHAWRRLLDLPADEFDSLRHNARQRIAANFSLRTSVEQYEALYREVGRTHGNEAGDQGTADEPRGERPVNGKI